MDVEFNREHTVVLFDPVASEEDAYFLPPFYTESNMKPFLQKIHERFDKIAVDLSSRLGSYFKIRNT